MEDQMEFQKKEIMKSNLSLFNMKILFMNFGFNDNDIISEVKSENSTKNEIQNGESLDNEIYRLKNSNELNGKIIIFKIDVDTKNFIINEKQNYRNVALYFFNMNIYFIDHTGEDISSDLKNSSYFLKSNEIKISKAKLEILNDEKNCEVLLPLAIFLIKVEFNDRDFIDLNQAASKDIVTTLRFAINQNKEIDIKLIYYFLNNYSDKIKSSKNNQISKCKQLIATLDNCFKIFQSIKENHRQITNNHNLIKRKKISEEEYNKNEIELNSRHFEFANQYNNICKNSNIDPDEKITSNSVAKLINLIITKFYKDPEFKYKMSYEITSILGEAIKYSNTDFLFQIEIMKISSNVQSVIQKNETHELRIRKCLKRDFNYSQIELKAVGMGKNNAFFAKTPDGNKYIKPCGYGLIGLNTIDGKIHPNELFLYKLLEYLDFGPKVHFLLQENASGSIYIYSPSVIAHGNYIMTDEVPNLLLDTDEMAQSTINIKEYEQFIKSNMKLDAIELSLASLIKDLLSLSDVYPNNGQNYGLYKRNGMYKFVFIDHIPGSNGIFSGVQFEKDKIKNYSPRTQMELFNKDKSYGNLTDLSENHNMWNKYSLTKEVNERIFIGIGYNSVPINDAIQEAQDYILEIINKYPNNFATFYTENNKEINSETVLRCYVNKIKSNIENYQRTNYAQNYLEKK